MENDSLTSMKDAVKKYKEQAFPEISLCGPWSIISYLIAFRGEKSVHDVVTSWYDENSDMFILPDDDKKISFYRTKSVIRRSATRTRCGIRLVLTWIPA